MSRAIRPDIRLGVRTGSEPESNGRTDGRTEGNAAKTWIDPSLAERARAYRDSSAITLDRLLADAGVDAREVNPQALSEISTRLGERNRDGRGAASISQVIDEWLDSLEETYGKRWPVIRSGERAHIPNVVRLSVYVRDGFHCQRRDFGWHTEALELDHCIPWSAGGPDDSDNLRTLCSACNAERSNFVDDAHAHVYRPTTWWCLDCWSNESKRYHHPWKDGTHLEVVPPIIVEECDAIEQVYCAFCDRHSMSPLFFVGERGRQLARQVWVPEGHPDRGAA